MGKNSDTEAKYSPPQAAYRAEVAYDSATDSYPREIDYGVYRKVGLIRNIGQVAQTARRQAREKYGERVNIFQSGNWWVVYLYE